MAAVFLEQGRQTPESIATLLCGYLAEARASLDIAIYDMVLEGAAHDLFAQTIAGLNARGIRPRLLYNHEERRARAGPPPPKMVVAPPDLIRGCDAVPIPGTPDLMHHKYVVRDAESVWTGSTNWTNDSWSFEENVIVRIDNAAVAAAFASDFAELWAKRQVAPTGHYRPQWIDIQTGLKARPYFTPSRAQKLVHEISQRLSTATRRIRLVSPVLTDGPILGTLAQMVQDGLKVDARGIFDATQMLDVRHQWSQNPMASWKIAALNQVLAHIPFSGKPSTPWSQDSVHDFMHAKFVVVDDFVFVGSYNLSHSGEQNAENVVELENAALADMFVEYADRIIARYPPAVVP